MIQKSAVVEAQGVGATQEQLKRQMELLKEILKDVEDLGGVPYRYFEEVVELIEKGDYTLANHRSRDLWWDELDEDILEEFGGECAVLDYNSLGTEMNHTIEKIIDLTNE